MNRPYICSGGTCSKGFEFSYSIDTAPTDSFGTIAVVTDRFLTEAAATAAAQGTVFTAQEATADLFLPCGFCSDAFGAITLQVVLQAMFDNATPDIGISADDLARLSVNFSPCGDGGCSLGTPGGFNPDAFDFDVAACDTGSGGCDALFETADIIFDVAFNCTGPGCLKPIESVFTDPGLSKVDYIMFSQTPFEEQPVFVNLSVRRENIFRSLGSNSDNGSDLPEEVVEAVGQYMSDNDIDAFYDTVKRVYAGDQQIFAELDQSIGQFVQNPNRPDFIDAAGMINALNFQNQTDMNEAIESVIPELAGIVALAQAGPVKTYAAANGPATIVTAFADTR